MHKSFSVNRSVLTLVLLVFVALGFARAAQAQSSSGTGSIQGTVTDPSGKPISGAAVGVTSSSEFKRTALTGADGKFTVSSLPAGTYEVEISATGFATQLDHDVVVSSGSAANVPAAMRVASVSEEVRVEANADTSLASQLSPVKSVLDAGSARTEITSEYVNEFTSPVTDFADITQAAPGTVSYSTNGVGLGQAKFTSAASSTTTTP
jgi:iron complex outermembrane recepter protein